MSIKDFVEKIKPPWQREILTEDMFVVVLIFFVAFTSFGLGKLSTYEKKKPAIQIRQSATVLDSTNHVTPTLNQKTQFVSGIVFASKSGTRYYYAHCSSSVKEANKVWFQTVAEAEARGLSLASGCQSR